MGPVFKSLSYSLKCGFHLKIRYSTYYVDVKLTSFLRPIFFPKEAGYFGLCYSNGSVIIMFVKVMKQFYIYKYLIIHFLLKSNL